MLSEEKCQLLAPPKQAVRGTEALQVPHTIATIWTGQVILLHTAINVQKHFLHLSHVCFSLSAIKTCPSWPCFPLLLFCRWSVWKMPGVGRRRSVHVRYFFLCSATPQDPPTETGSQRYILARLPVRLCPSFLFRSLYQSRPGLTANACQLPLCEASQISQAVSLASVAHRHWARTGHLTHIGPLFRHHRLSPAANLIGLYAGRTFRANFADE